MDGEDLGAGGCCGTCGGAAPKPRLQPLAAAEARTRSVFRIPGMDCPSEEQMIRLRLAEAPVAALAFDLAGRRLTVDHDGDPQAILARLVPLGYGAELAESHTLAADEAAPAAPADDAAEARVLWILLALNAVMFVVELGAGIWARSAGLVADAMDMFADAAVYGVALYAVGRAARYKLGAARLAGGLQLVLALGALAEVVRRIVGDATPEPIGMMGIALPMQFNKEYSGFFFAARVHEVPHRQLGRGLPGGRAGRRDGVPQVDGRGGAVDLRRPRAAGQRRAVRSGRAGQGRRGAARAAGRLTRRPGGPAPREPGPADRRRLAPLPPRPPPA